MNLRDRVHKKQWAREGSVLHVCYTRDSEHGYNGWLTSDLHME
jgi:hypothetical protein